MFSLAINSIFLFLALSFLQSCSASPTGSPRTINDLLRHKEDANTLFRLAPNDPKLRDLLNSAFPEFKKRLNMKEIYTVGYIGEATTYRHMYYTVPNFQLLADGRTRECKIEFQANADKLTHISSLSC